MKTIYYLEDDWNYAKLVIADLNRQAEMENLTWRIIRIPTESEFISKVSDIKKGKATTPDVFMLDIMVRFSTPSPEELFEEQAAEAPYDRSGIRCMDLVRKGFPDCPMILYSVLEEQDLPPSIFNERVSFVAKDSNTKTLFKELCRVLS